MSTIIQHFALFDLLILAGISFLLVCSYFDEGEA
ncbi:hypothetical protein ACVMB3_000453 [Sinorhizobium meliloti]|jgi:hypothetical protein|uniref:Uncharacterized protein n=2 Tax=Rhizobium meliloti TaxID=382 RepID=H0GAR1_RHIML|nr:hypothetical protein SinmeB_1883 [Sinorhizobium meliloti BL225C]AEG53762.1 hypothetical protein Sinme_2039 [Sinorhizobium meliloti AK83]AEH78537.1 hypothetical protein SM11_chr1260 [Sinorhizobium meliloti SM11]AGA07042.1 hypothetical protein C770_GR4Chr2115 [Sinorhizobium meliloti GR4]AIM00007.1 membrane protein [Sinorhizobium meliloti]EHK73598.1 hypothetical protein SM0020_33112 [Sinorhizobium meliloti CCNWSX0020]PII38576.1 membrane protein [Sinorhizobium meliloti CCBAU 01290]TWA90258.1 